MRVFCDFDGTITEKDTIVFLTEQFGAGVEFRRRILDDITQGRITVFEAIRRELKTVRVSWQEALETLRGHVRIDPTFPAFVEWCRLEGIPLAVVSSGMQPVVEEYVGEFGIPIYAHEVRPHEEGWRYRRRPEHDKERLLEQTEDESLVFIGDGTSDVGVIPFVDLLFAKRGRFLEKYCLEKEEPFFPFSNFAEVRGELQCILEGDRTAGG